MTTPERRERAIDAAIEELGWEWEAEPGIPSPRELAGEVVDAVLAAVDFEHGDEPTPAEWREGYVLQQAALQARHNALLTLWRAVVPGTEYSTFGDDPQIVVDAVLAVLKNSEVRE